MLPSADQGMQGMQWLQWANLAGQHALFVYAAILGLLLTAFATLWWIWHRYTAQQLAPCPNTPS